MLTVLERTFFLQKHFYQYNTNNEESRTCWHFKFECCQVSQEPYVRTHTHTHTHTVFILFLDPAPNSEANFLILVSPFQFNTSETPFPYNCQHNLIEQLDNCLQYSIQGLLVCLSACLSLCLIVFFQSTGNKYPSTGKMY